MTRAGNSIAKDLIRRIEEPCEKHDGKPFTLPDGRHVCNKCGKDWKT